MPAVECREDIDVYYELWFWNMQLQAIFKKTAWQVDMALMKGINEVIALADFHYTRFKYYPGLLSTRTLTCILKTVAMAI